MKFRWSLVAVFVLATSMIYAQEANAPKFGKGLFNLVGKDSSWTMKVGFRMQLLGTSTWQDGESSESNMLVRRSRLKFDGFAFSPKLQYKVELGLSNRDMSGVSAYTSNSPRYIMDAVLKWNFAGNFVLWAGQTKLPGNRERVISSGDLQLVDRSLLNSRFNIDRDMGLQLRHHFNLSEKFIVKEVLSISQGEGRNVTTGNQGGHQYTGRVELYPFGSFESKGDYTGSDLKREKTPKLAIGTTYNFNNNAVRERGNLGSYMETAEGLYETNISTIFIDAMFKYKGISFMGEYSDRTADDPIAKNADGTLTGQEVQVGKGINLMAGYLFKNNWEVTGRYTHIELDKNVTGKDPETQYTLGLSKFISGHKLKVQTDISYLDVPTNNGQIMYRLQCDIHF
ncbi:porin [Aestuariibaculum suncheonense]|uniref:Porin n=1 Tax=Aestuariibaculum suncheonense TaxID=1028745 RepID=A0A8J6QY23_9FLAO|nr:porin [Aestuariibaculum suncheonense]MBD0836589.1 porin [Aestuariibaculum suncheonense]